MAHVHTIGQLAKKDVAVCQAADNIATLQSRMRASPWDMCVVVNTERVVLGLLHKSAWEEADGATPVEQVMELAPPTFRPHATREEMAGYMQKKKLKTALVTTPDGKLLGLLRRNDLE